MGSYKPKVRQGMYCFHDLTEIKDALPAEQYKQVQSEVEHFSRTLAEAEVPDEVPDPLPPDGVSQSAQAVFRVMVEKVWMMDDEYRKKKEQGRKARSGVGRSVDIGRPTEINLTEPNVAFQNINERKEDERKPGENENTVAFVPPSLQEIQAYINEMGFACNAVAIHAFYSSNGWKVGKNPMKDWKAAVRSWEARDKNVIPASHPYGVRPYYNPFEHLVVEDDDDREEKKHD